MTFFFFFGSFKSILFSIVFSSSAAMTGQSFWCWQSLKSDWLQKGCKAPQALAHSLNEEWLILGKLFDAGTAKEERMTRKWLLLGSVAKLHASSFQNTMIRRTNYEAAWVGIYEVGSDEALSNVKGAAAISGKYRLNFTGDIIVWILTRPSKDQKLLFPGVL